MHGILADMDFVDSGRMAVGGHSMGTWSSWSVAADFSGTDISPKAVILQCGEIFTDNAYDSERIKFSSVLLLQAKYDEFSYFRDFKNTVNDDLLRSELRAGFLGCMPEDAEWDTDFGSFSDGTARRIELLNTNHRLVTKNRKGVAAAVNWLSEAVGLDQSIAARNQTALLKELCVFIAMLLAIAATLALLELLLYVPWFYVSVQKLDKSSTMIKTGRQWWKGAAVTFLIAGLTYPFMTQLGHGLLPLPESIFRMTVGDGFISWYLLLIIIMLLTTFASYRKSRRKSDPLNFADLGLSLDRNRKSLAGGLRQICSSCCPCVRILIHTDSFKRGIFGLDFRFIWPFSGVSA